MKEESLRKMSFESGAEESLPEKGQELMIEDEVGNLGGGLASVDYSS